MGKNSVSYNPINLEYHKNSDGVKLSQDDANALYRTSMRAAHLYLKNNTFDPLRCQDIPRRLVIDPNQGAKPSTTNPTASSDMKGQDSAELDVPRRLAQIAAQRAHVVKTKLKDNAEKVLMVEMARTVNGNMKIAAAGTARSVSVVDAKREPGTIVVEIDGNGKQQHSWTRHI
ncbi:hypothetical protein HDU98_007856 [Podochytrium sp. JEL0797]|nr:hypothetical protein HDU98_007856 [Podochytrium sp. JEL0797]